MVTPRVHEMSISIILYSMALMSYCGNKLLISMSNPTCMSVLENIEKNLLQRAHQNYIAINKSAHLTIFMLQKHLGMKISWKILQLIFISRCFCSMYYQGSTNCAILPSRMGEHGVSLENMENMKRLKKSTR